ncbi:MAG TPA: phosphotriesterase [Blastocatellia bacterium]|nr:phosphotriesterase [Blastocatellia bacterium]
MQRREFLATSVMATAGFAAEPFAAPRAKAMTVRGPMNAALLGTVLMHEHVMVDFIGADKVNPNRYHRDEVFRTALPFLQQAARNGVKTLVECTPAWLGRDPELLRRLSLASKLNIITNTGYYGAANDKFVPAHAYQESAEQLAARWVKEFQFGIDGTGIKPGIIKIGVDAGPLSEIDTKLVKAAALTHLQTGLTIGAHTGDGIAAIQQLDLLASLGVQLGAFIWIHAQNEKDPVVHRRAAERGCWVEFDGINPNSAAKHAEYVTNLAEQNLLGRVLISMDAGWYHVGEPQGGKYRDYSSLFTDFLPILKKQLNTRQIAQLLNDNPHRALSLEVKRKTRNDD